MPPATGTVTATAPGKIILLGEHAVVYGRPAIAAPVWQRHATATLTDLAPGSGCTLVAPDVSYEARLRDAAPDHPLAVVVRATLARCHLSVDPDWRIEASSTLPIAGGLGSGAALSAAVARAVMQRAGIAPDPHAISEIVYESETLYHGTPSGIDNTVVAYGQPVWFVKGDAPQVFAPARPFRIAIADSGIAASTRTMVLGVRERWSAEPARYDALFDAVAEVVTTARTLIEHGETAHALGTLFNRNQELLQEIGVSVPALERLISAARDAGALGAKLSGAGGGGNVIALVDDESDHNAEEVRAALLSAGARDVILTVVEAYQGSG